MFRLSTFFLGSFVAWTMRAVAILPLDKDNASLTDLSDPGQHIQKPYS
jgi:hypothetical protein